MSRELALAACTRKTLKAWMRANPKASLDDEDPGGSTALHWAVENEKHVAAKNLMDAGADVRVGSTLGFNLLMLAVIKDMPQTAYLVNALAPGLKHMPNALIDEYPLQLAIKQGALFAVKLLLTLDVDLKREYGGLSALLLAVQARNVDIVSVLLLTHKFNVDAPGAHHLHPLYIAVQYGDVQMVECLLEEGKADVSVTTPCGIDALTAACDSGRAAIVKLLVKHGARVDQRNAQGCLPVGRAIAGGHLDVVRVIHELYPLTISALLTAVFSDTGIDMKKMVKLLLDLVRPSQQDRTAIAKTATHQIQAVLMRQCAVPECGEWGQRSCGRCKKTYYCSVECQTTGWEGGHKEECHRP